MTEIECKTLQTQAALTLCNLRVAKKTNNASDFILSHPMRRAVPSYVADHGSEGLGG